MPQQETAYDLNQIEVILYDGSFYFLKPRELDVLLEHDMISKFKRSSGWVTVGVDPIRTKKRLDAVPEYYGKERRMQ